MQGQRSTNPTLTVQANADRVVVARYRRVVVARYRSTNPTLTVQANADRVVVARYRRVDFCTLRAHTFLHSNLHTSHGLTSHILKGSVSLDSITFRFC